MGLVQLIPNCMFIAESAAECHFHRPLQFLLITIYSPMWKIMSICDVELGLACARFCILNKTGQRSKHVELERDKREKQTNAKGMQNRPDLARRTCFGKKCKNRGNMQNNAKETRTAIFAPAFPFMSFHFLHFHAFSMSDVFALCFCSCTFLRFCFPLSIFSYSSQLQFSKVRPSSQVQMTYRNHWKHRNIQYNTI